MGPTLSVRPVLVERVYVLVRFKSSLFEKIFHILFFIFFIFLIVFENSRAGENPRLHLGFSLLEFSQTFDSVFTSL